jgi:hypothetical protein
MKMPVNFEQFQKNPTAAIAFIALAAVGYLYIDQKMSNSIFAHKILESLFHGIKPTKETFVKKEL